MVGAEHVDDAWARPRHTPSRCSAARTGGNSSAASCPSRGIAGAQGQMMRRRLAVGDVLGLLQQRNLLGGWRSPAAACTCARTSREAGVGHLGAADRRGFTYSRQTACEAGSPRRASSCARSAAARPRCGRRRARRVRLRIASTPEIVGHRRRRAGRGARERLDPRRAGRAPGMSPTLSWVPRPRRRSRNACGP